MLMIPREWRPQRTKKQAKRIRTRKSLFVPLSCSKSIVVANDHPKPSPRGGRFECVDTNECVIERMIANVWRIVGEKEKERAKESTKCRSQYAKVCDG